MKKNKNGVYIDLRSYRKCKGKSKLDKRLLSVLDKLSQNQRKELKSAGLL